MPTADTHRTDEEERKEKLGKAAQISPLVAVRFARDPPYGIMALALARTNQSSNIRSEQEAAA
jgi:hypothetical protein